jgi:hypothetical protein
VAGQNFKLYGTDGNLICLTCEALFKYEQTRNTSILLLALYVIINFVRKELCLDGHIHIDAEQCRRCCYHLQIFSIDEYLTIQGRSTASWRCRSEFCLYTVHYG